VTTPAPALLTLDEAKAAVGETGTANDATLQALILTVSEHLEERYGDLLPGTYATTVPVSGGVALVPRYVDNVLLTETGEPVEHNRAAGLVTGLGHDFTVRLTYTVPLRATVKQAAAYVLQHAWESQQGAVPVPYQSGSDETFTISRGFFVPNRAKELLESLRGSVVA
jgi:ABC-type dipeptide/oligopeptide/nickel transport system ATPase component